MPKTGLVERTVGHLPTVHKATSRSPIELERARRVRHLAAIEGESLIRGLRVGKFNEAVASISGRCKRGSQSQVHKPSRCSCVNIPRVLIADDLNINSFARSRQENSLYEVFIHPWLQLAHPVPLLDAVLPVSIANEATYQSVVLGESRPEPGGGATAPMSAGGVPF